MIGFTQTVIFATFQRGKAEVFDNLVRAINPTAFTLRRDRDGKPLVFKNTFSLLDFLRIEGKNNLADTLLILDFEILRQSEGQDAVEIFLLYPELKTKIFMDTPPKKSLYNIPVEQLKRSQLIVENLESFIKAGCSVNINNMLFDPTGIRNRLKMEMIADIGFSVNNYAGKEKSRKDHFALSLDHDPHHSLFVGYALYNFGYSVLPVISYNELEYLCAEEVRADIICRECDLQFHDMLIQQIRRRKRKMNKENSEEKDPSGKIYEVRGIESVSHGRRQRKATRLRIDLYEKLLHKGHGTTWFVTQYEGLDDQHAGDKISRGNFKSIKDINKTSHGNPFFVINANRAIEEKDPDFKKYGITIGTDCPAALLRGQSKIIKGIYSLLQCPEVKQRHHDSMDIYEINRLRKGREFHDKMAVNLQLARKMFDRARSMFLLRNYLETAVLAIDALELSNGLSMALSLEILSLKIKAETRLELIGAGIGKISAEDIKEKIKEIKINVMRICKNNDESEKNSLMQYFNSLRKIYHEFEQFEAAETLYDEVLAIETGSKRYRDLTLGKIIEKATESKHIEKGSPSDLTRFESMQLLARIALTNFNVALGVLLTIVLITDLWLNHSLFPIAYFVLLAGFCMAPKRAIYMIIGAGINFRRFTISFFLSQVIIAFIYVVNLGHGTIHTEEGITGHMPTYLAILRQTVLSSLMNQPSSSLNEIMKAQPEIMQWLVTGHIAITVIFLGIFITAIYRWLTRR